MKPGALRVRPWNNPPRKPGAPAGTIANPVALLIQTHLQMLRTVVAPVSPPAHLAAMRTSPLQRVSLQFMRLY